MCCCCWCFWATSEAGAVQRAAAVLPNGRYQEIADASTNVADEQPAAFANAVADFLLATEVSGT